MQEKLSVCKVYKNAFKYVTAHPGTFALLIIFYFLGNLLPMIIGLNSFKIVMLVYYYMFLYLAAGCYYKQRILLDKHTLGAAALRFLTTILVFLAAMLISVLPLICCWMPFVTLLPVAVWSFMLYCIAKRG